MTVTWSVITIGISVHGLSHFMCTNVPLLRDILIFVSITAKIAKKKQHHSNGLSHHQSRICVPQVMVNNLALIFVWFLVTGMLVVWLYSRWGCQEVSRASAEASWAPCSGRWGGQLFSSHPGEGWPHPGRRSRRSSFVYSWNVSSSCRFIWQLWFNCHTYRSNKWLTYVSHCIN